MKKDAPCYHCEGRHDGCHGTCDRYAQWKEDRAEALREHTKQQIVEQELIEFQMDKNRRLSPWAKKRR